MEFQEIKIAVCDDHQEMNQIMSEIIHNVMDDKSIAYRVLEFNSGKSLLEQIENIDIVFLDIEMPEIDGIDTAIQIRQLKPDCKIVIASAREERMKDCFHVNALRFVSKPYDDKEVCEALETYLAESQLGLQKIEAFNDRKPYWIRQKDIQYIKAYNGAVNIYTKNFEFRKGITLNKIEKLLDQRLFFKIHKTCIVGLYHVIDYTEKEVLIEKKKLPLSRRNRTEFEKRYIDFDIKYRG